ncbi:MAG: xylulokinase [Ardenticatenaceae bacterium]|nr:xylulokinase [Ardenticatenaceae bacterium]MCB8948603.1 xylulokinase [Ardenticatenaceae bacterium]
MNYFIGIDSSTTATKALLLAESGEVVGVASSTYDYETPKPLWSEQRPELWWTATVDSIQQLLAETAVSPQAIKGIGLTGQMHGLVLLDKDGEVLRPALLWNDQRTGAECDEMRAVIGKAKLIDITGNDALTGFTAPKILWVKNNEPEIYGRIAHILLPKDYVRYKLTGEMAMDKAGGAGTQLFDVRQRDWSQELVTKLGIDPAWLPKTFEGTAVTGQLTQAAAEVTGLPVGIPVVGGGGDQAANAVGTGAVVDGVVALSLGTSGVVFASSDVPIVEPDGRLHAFCHAAPGKWHLMGVMLSAAGSLRWYRDALAPGVDFGDLLIPAADVPAGSEGLLFLPYLTGERTPHPDPLARGGFIGLTVRHSQAHLTRAVLEGVAFGLRDSLELMRGAGLADITQIRASGGGLRSLLWRQILADVLQAEIVTVNTTEGAAYGAAVLALVGAGGFDSVESACASLVKVTGRTEPGMDTAVYNQLYPIYQQLYPALKSSFAALAQ